MDPRRWLLFTFLAAVVYSSRIPGSEEGWRCPQIEDHPVVECYCDNPHTLRCFGDRSAMQIIGRTLRSLPTHRAVTLLDCRVQNVSALSGSLLEGVALQGLVVSSSGEIKDIHSTAFKGLASPLRALGLPNNQLTTIPTAALSQLIGLDRLDLSLNKLTKIEADSFKGLSNLTYLRLNDNQLQHLSPGCFRPLKYLSTLFLSGNNLTVPSLTTLKDLTRITELDLSGNSIPGTLGPNTLPSLKTLRLLQLNNNALTSIKRGALAGLVNLTSLSLRNNQIDVIEDYAFRQLSNLTELDLAHNRIVAVSGNSLAHLVKLEKLDVSHNVLRALSGDLIAPLKALTELYLDVNDISMISGDTLNSDVKLKRFSILDNPLNCDCSLMEFVQWLQESEGLSKADRLTPVCITPPNLEGARLLKLPVRKLGCSGYEDDTTTILPEMTPHDTYTPSLMAADFPLFEANITLTEFQYDGSLVRLRWEVEADVVPYTCDSIFVFEEFAKHEVHISTEPLHCDSAAMTDPTNLHITVPGSRDLEQDHRYRYCLVLLKESMLEEDLSRVVGCSEPILLSPTSDTLTKKEPAIRVSGLRSNVTVNGTIFVEVSLFGFPPNKPENLEMLDTQQSQEINEMLNNCYVSLAVFAQGSLIAQRDAPCHQSLVVMEGFFQGPYRVCATLSEFQVTGPSSRCIKAQKIKPTKTASVKGINVALVAAFVGLIVAIMIIAWGARKLLKKPLPVYQTHQCFMPDPQNCEEVQHSGYVKLHATTKV